MYNTSEGDITDDIVDLNYFETSRFFFQEHQDSVQILKEALPSDEEQETKQATRSLQTVIRINSTRLSLKDEQGNVVLNTSVGRCFFHEDQWKSKSERNHGANSGNKAREGTLLRRWNREKEILTFLHIGEKHAHTNLKKICVNTVKIGRAIFT